MKALSQPLFASLRGYDRQQLGPDLFSGVLIALLSIPISMGYAQLAGLPPVYGLYGSLIPILLFAMLSTTREFIFGVDAAPAAMIGAVLASLGVTAGSAEAMRIVPVLTLYVALWLAVFALVRADRAVDYISEPVMGGFISGVCCEIILMQVPKLLGSGTGTGELFELLGHIFDAAKTVNLPTAALGFGTLAILLLAPRKWPKVPWVLVMMVLGGLLGAFAPLADRGVALLAAVPRGLPKPVLPDLTALPFTEALVATLPVAAVILAETLLASSGTAQKNGYRLNGRREIAAYAVCNVAAGLVGCCVVSGSVSRTAVNERNGGKTQLVSVTASVTMLLVLLFATPLIRFLPVPVLTAIVVNALIGATEFGIARRLWRVNRVELGIFTGAFLGVLLLGAIKGVLVGMVLSFVDVLMRAAAPQRTFLGTLPGKSGFFPIDRVSGVQPLPHIVLYRFSGSLFFANIRRFQEDIEGAVQPDTQAVIVDGSAVVSVDITACDRLVALNRKLRAQGVRFYLTEHIGEVNDQLRHFEAGELIETGAVRRTIRGALRDAGVTLDPGSSYQKIPGNMDDIRQLQELEWLYGADAEVQIERNVQLMLARMRTTDDVRARRAMLEHFLNEDFHFGSIDADEVLLHLEGHTDELAELLENSEDDVFTDLEVERDSLIDRVEQDYPELVEHVRERRDHLDHDFHANHPSSAARIAAGSSCAHASSASAPSETSAAPSIRPSCSSGMSSTPPRIRNGTSSTPPSSSCATSGSLRSVCAARRRRRSRANSGRRQSWPKRRSVQPSVPAATPSTPPSARKSTPRISRARCSATPSTRPSASSATPRTRQSTNTSTATRTERRAHRRLSSRKRGARRKISLHNSETRSTRSTCRRRARKNGFSRIFVLFDEVYQIMSTETWGYSPRTTRFQHPKHGKISAQDRENERFIRQLTASPKFCRGEGYGNKNQCTGGRAQ